MKIFEAKTFWQFLDGYLQQLPNRGHGELRRIATGTGIHTTTLSQALKGARPFSLEQVVKICDYLGLSELETKYGVVLLQKERAGTERLRQIFSAELLNIKNQGKDLTHVVRKDKKLKEAEKAIFYSNWYYSAIAVLSSIEGFQDASSIGSRISLPNSILHQAIDFLLKTGICVRRGQKVEPGTKSTHLESGSPLISRHHGNWRFRAMERHPSLNQDSEIAYSSPMSLAKSDAAKIRSMIVDLVKKVNEIRDPSPCEEAYCLNVDWFKV